MHGQKRLLPALYLVMTSAWGSELMILDSTEPTLPVAEVIPSDMVIQLPKGTAVTLVSENGEEFTLVGPFEGLPKPRKAPAMISYMVVESDLEDLPVSEVVASDQRLDIPKGARVVLVAKSGQELILDGPFQGLPSEVELLVTDEDQGSGASVGATRSFK